MKNSISGTILLFLLAILMLIWLSGCHHDEELLGLPIETNIVNSCCELNDSNCCLVIPKFPIIKKMEVLQIPARTANGEIWDINDNSTADIYFEFSFLNEERVLYSDTLYNDVISNDFEFQQPLFRCHYDLNGAVFEEGNLPISLTLIDELRISMLDLDYISWGSRIKIWYSTQMTTFFFNPKEFADERPSNILLRPETGNCGTVIRLTVEWL